MLVALAVMVLTGCTGTGEGTAPTERDTTSGSDTATASDTVTPTPSDEPTPFPSVTLEEVIGPECEDGPDRRVTQLTDVVVPEVRIPATTVPDTELDDGTIAPGIDVPAQVVPAQVVDTGCIIEHTAPGACLGRVEITAMEIPGVEIPGVEIAGAELPNGSSVGPREMGPRSVGPRGVGERSVGQRCQPERDSGVRPAVVRPAVVRPAVVRPAVVRPAVVRPAVCGDTGCVEAVTVPAVTVEAVSVEAVSVEAAVIEAVVVDEDVQRFDGEQRQSYVAPADVLFDVDEARLRPSARQTLQSIVDDLDRTLPFPVVIEGHTDSTGTEEHNLDLSRRRAEAVADWLVEEAGVDRDDIEIVARGESTPAADNDTEEGRQQNRRVVITVEGEPSQP